MSTFEWIQVIVSSVTALGVVIAALQLRTTRQQVQMSFEDAFSEQYRRIIAQLPLKALLGRTLTNDELDASLRSFYEYFDLSNEQAFLAGGKRLRQKT